MSSKIQSQAPLSPPSEGIVFWNLAQERHSVFLLVFGALISASLALLIHGFSSPLTEISRLWQSSFFLFYLSLAYSLWNLHKSLFLLQSFLLLGFSIGLNGLPLLQPEIFTVLHLEALQNFLLFDSQTLLPWQIPFNYLVIPFTALWLLFYRSLKPWFMPTPED